MSSADNQQERLNHNWISGFVDGEGCFHVAINKLPKMSLGYQVLPEFRIVQHKRDIQILDKIKKTLGVGHVVRNHGDRFELRIRSLEDLNKIVSFFDNNPLMTKKKTDFKYFKEVIRLMMEKQHLSLEGLKKIANLSSLMNRQRNIDLESSETIRQKQQPNVVKI